jgi:TPR repeat protein
MKKIIWIFIIFALSLHADNVDKGMQAIKKRAYDQAFIYFKKACDNGNLKGCVKLGVCYQKGKGVKKDISKAVEYLKNACQQEEHGGCMRLAFIYRTGKGLKKDPQKALSIYKELCQKDYASACFMMGRLYDSGELVTQNPLTALDFYKKACNLKERISCMILGDTYANVAGRVSVKKDVEKAIVYYKKGCAIEKTSFCDDVSLFQLIKQR